MRWVGARVVYIRLALCLHHFQRRWSASRERLRAMLVGVENFHVGRIYSLRLLLLNNMRISKVREISGDRHKMSIVYVVSCTLIHDFFIASVVCKVETCTSVGQVLLVQLRIHSAPQFTMFLSLLGKNRLDGLKIGN